MNIIKKTPSDVMVLYGTLWYFMVLYGTLWYFMVLYGSIISFIYFITLLIISHFKIRFIIIGVFVELLTIPFILLLLFLTFYSIRETLKGKIDVKSNSYISLTILITTIVMLVIATIYD